MALYLSGGEIVFDEPKSGVVGSGFRSQGRPPGCDAGAQEGPGDDLVAVVEQLEVVCVVVAVELSGVDKKRLPYYTGNWNHSNHVITLESIEYITIVYRSLEFCPN